MGWCPLQAVRGVAASHTYGCSHTKHTLSLSLSLSLSLTLTLTLSLTLLRACRCSAFSHGTRVRLEMR